MVSLFLFLCHPSFLLNVEAVEGRNTSNVCALNRSYKRCFMMFHYVLFFVYHYLCCIELSTVLSLLLWNLRDPKYKFYFMHLLWTIKLFCISSKRPHPNRRKRERKMSLLFFSVSQTLFLCHRSFQVKDFSKREKERKEERKKKEEVIVALLGPAVSVPLSSFISSEWLCQEREREIEPGWTNFRKKSRLVFSVPQWLFLCHPLFQVKDFSNRGRKNEKKREWSLLFFSIPQTGKQVLSLPSFISSERLFQERVRERERGWGEGEGGEKNVTVVLLGPAVSIPLPSFKWKTFPRVREGKQKKKKEKEKKDEKEDEERSLLFFSIPQSLFLCHPSFQVKDFSKWEKKKRRRKRHYCSSRSRSHNST